MKRKNDFSMLIWENCGTAMRRKAAVWIWKTVTLYISLGTSKTCRRIVVSFETSAAWMKARP